MPGWQSLRTCSYKYIKPSLILKRSGYEEIIWSKQRSGEG